MTTSNSAQPPKDLSVSTGYRIKARELWRAASEKHGMTGFFDLLGDSEKDRAVIQRRFRRRFLRYRYLKQLAIP